MQKGKYYRMRKETGMGERGSWLPCSFFHSLGKMKDTADMPKQEEFTPMEIKELPSVQSELPDPEGCYLCGTQQRKV